MTYPMLGSDFLLTLTCSYKTLPMESKGVHAHVTYIVVVNSLHAYNKTIPFFVKMKNSTSRTNWPNMMHLSC